MLEVDSAGLDRSDRAFLGAIAEKFGGGPVGLSTLAVALGEEPDTIEDVLEPYLLQQGLLKRTPRGRVLTPRAFEHLGRAAPRRRCKPFLSARQEWAGSLALFTSLAACPSSSVPTAATGR